MENLIELLKKIITNVLTALYQPFWFAVILTVFLLFFYLYAYKPIDTGKGIRAAFRAWWQEFRTSLFFRKLFLLTFFTVMILFQTLINRNMWINPLSDIMGGWWIWHTAADGTVTLTTECFENIALMLPFTALLLWTVAASRAGVKKFVLISTDKAVNPTNIMGASKRLCEMVVQMMNRQCKDTDFVAVRFGNVLGSNGSVIPLFKKQIAEGGPVTVTDKNIIRYFMTIPEAVSLVLQAAHYAKGGEIFILDMGEPVRIDEMARNLIRLSGFTPDVDIKVEYTGLRPGEKLFEELLMAEEGMQETPNKLIHIGKPIEMDDVAFKKKLRQLDEAAYQETDRMKKLVEEVVPTYHPEHIEYTKTCRRAENE